MKLFLITMILLCCACGKKSDNVIVPPTPTTTASSISPPPEDPPILIEGGAWSFSIPGTWQKSEESPGNVKAVKKSESVKLTFTANSTKHTYQEETLLAIAAVKQNGGIVTFYAQPEINGYPWSNLLSTREDVMLVQYTTVKDKVVYSLYCGGSGNTLDCESIASTLVLK